MSLTKKTFFMCFLITSITLGLLTVLMHLKFNAVHSELVQGRLNVIAKDIQTVIEHELKLDVRLSDIENINEIIEQAKTKSQNIISIGIFQISNYKINIVGSTKGFISPPNLFSKIHNKLEQTESANWDFNGQNETSFFGLSFKDSAETIIGGVFIQYDKKEINKSLEQEIKNFYIRLFTCLIFFLPLILIASYLLVHQFNQSLTTMYDALKSFSQSNHVASVVNKEKIHDPNLALTFGAVTHSINTTMYDLKTFETLIKEGEEDSNEIL